MRGNAGPFREISAEEAVASCIRALGQALTEKPCGNWFPEGAKLPPGFLVQKL